jgi:cytochrome c oxidase cbb3-type subunit 3
MKSFPKFKLVIAAILFSTTGFAAGDALNEAINSPMVWAFTLAIVILIMALWALNKALNTIKWMTAKDKAEAADEVAVEQAPENTILHALTDAVPVENEEDILLDHDYDGIKELDNNLPPWWKYGFYITIVWGIGYFIAYHVLGSYPLQDEEFKIEMAEENAKVEAYIASLGAAVDESNVVALTDESNLAKGRTIFKQKCVACHLDDGGGNAIGPNLTDDYWINGDGSIAEIFKVVKYGGSDGSGMQSWDGELSAQKMQQVASFVLSLRGTTPAAPKDPQGEYYPLNTEESADAEMPAEDAENAAEETEESVTESTDEAGAE